MQKNQISYLRCPKSQHEGQMLNLVCIGCQQGGLICSLCREEHRNHQIVPLKILIHNLINKVTQDPSDEQYGIQMQQLQNIKHSLLFRLKHCVQSLSQSFEKLEQEIIDRYNELKLQIIEQIHLGTEIDQLLNGVVAGTISEELYRQNMEKLAKYVRPRDKEFVLSMDFKSIIEPLGKIQNTLTSRLKNIEDYVEKTLKIDSKDILPPPPPPPVFEVQQNYIYRFSNTLKASHVTLNDKRTIATQTHTQSGRFVLIEEGMGVQNRKIKFKVTNLKNWIGVGVCLKNKIAAVNYQFKYEVLGHGSFLLSNNGYTWSHSASEDNIHSCLFTFKQDDLVEVTLEPNFLTFKINDNPNIFKLKVDYSAQEWPHVCFCANLCSQGDAIEIVDK